MTNTMMNMTDRHMNLIETMSAAFIDDHATMRIALIAYAEHLAEVAEDEVRPYADALRAIGRDDWAQEIEDDML